MSTDRAPQLAYSDFQPAMLNEAKRRGKAAKLISVLCHFLGREDLSGLSVADIGCSAGFIADELAEAGAAHVAGIDIDIPGLSKAQDRFGKRVSFVCGDGARLPFPDGSLDAVVFNHIYEHVVDPDAVVRELHRVLKDDGALYLGLANKWGIVEPHYNLPFLSYLPYDLADRYVKATGKAERYYERFRTRRGMRAMLPGFEVWDYTFSVMAEPDRFHADAEMPGPAAKLPMPALKALRPILPTFLWVATKSAGGPRGPKLAEPPRSVA
jgi:SAM-dependent methyltransferase